MAHPKQKTCELPAKTEGSSAKTTKVTLYEMLNSPKSYEEIIRIM